MRNMAKWRDGDTANGSAHMSDYLTMLQAARDSLDTLDDDELHGAIEPLMANMDLAQMCRNVLAAGSTRLYEVVRFYREDDRTDEEIARADFKEMLGERVQDLGTRDLWVKGPANLERPQEIIAEILRGSASVMMDQGISAQEIAQTIQDDYVYWVNHHINAEEDPAIRAGLKDVYSEAVVAAAEMEAQAEAEAAWERAQAKREREQNAARSAPSGCADMREVFGQAAQVGVLLKLDGPEKITCSLLSGSVDSPAAPAAVCAALVQSHMGRGAWAAGPEAYTAQGETLCVDEHKFRHRIGAPPSP